MPNLLLQNINIDWKELREHKEELLNIIENTDLDSHHEAIFGITNLIDYLQDQAVESGMWSESEVFGEGDQYFQWEEKYKPIENHFPSKNGAYNGKVFETFGDELEYVRTYPDQRKVWTLLDVDGKLYISAGYYIVNRFGYFITEIAWETGTEEFYSE